MPALETPAGNLGWKAAPFSLRGTDGQTHTLESARGSKGLVVLFICNHCPYVQKQLDRMVSDATALKAEGVNFIGIMSNDVRISPEDSFEKMQKLAADKKFPFPYVIDETQEIARAYGAVCTPDIFGFNANLELQYRGRLDESWSGIMPNAKRELLLAMKEIAATGKGPAVQNHSIGCSIKWAADRKSA